jgi:Protein of unknown function (DUF2852)
MVIAAKLDEFGRPAWLTVMVLGFIVWWPIGLAILGFMLWSGRMGWGRGHWGRWKKSGCTSRAAPWHARGSDSGNSAFEDYKAETLRRLEDEQQEFLDFLQRLRQSKDKAEFDQFMADRRNKPQTPPEYPTPDAPPAS